MSQLIPGYKHVTEFGPAEEYEEEEEVCYVTFDLGNVDRALLPNTSEYRLVGLDTPTPMIQLSGTFFKGKYEELIGTELLFTDGRDDANPSKRFVVPVGTTEQRIKFEQVDVKPKNASSQATGGDDRAMEAGSSKSSSRGKSGRGRGRGSRKGKGREMHPQEQIVDLDIDPDT